MRYKSTIVLIITVFFVQTMYGQYDLKISNLNDSKLVRVLNNSQLIAENRENYLSVRVYKMDNGSGSAGFPEGHEVSHNLLVAVSEYDEQPVQNLFEIGPFFNPKFVKWLEVKKYQKEFEIEYGVFDSRKSVKLIVNINELKME